MRLFFSSTAGSVRGRFTESFALSVGKGAAGFGMNRLLAGDFLEAPDAAVDVARVEFDHVRASAGPFGCEQGRAAAPEAIEHHSPALGAVQNRIGYQRDRLHGWMRRALLKPSGMKRIRT